MAINRKPDLKAIPGPCICLRPLNENDLPMTLEWRNQDHIREWFFDSKKIDHDQHIKWFDNYLNKDNDYVYIIEEKRGAQNSPIGQIALYNLDKENKCAELGRLMIGEHSARGKGLAKAAVNQLIFYAENHLNIRMIHLEVLENNLSAIAVYISCGFRLENISDRVMRMEYKSLINV